MARVVRSDSFNTVEFDSVQANLTEFSAIEVKATQFKPM